MPAEYRIVKAALVLLFAVLLAGTAFSAYVQSSLYPSFGKSVSLGLAFNITGRTTDNLSGSNDYVAAASPDAVLGIASPRAFGSRYDVNYSSDNYVIELRTPLEDSRFFLVFTPGNTTVITGRIESLKLQMPARTFGDLKILQPEAVDIFLRVDYSNVNILGRLQLGPGSRRISIKNDGTDKKGVTNVSMELVR